MARKKKDTKEQITKAVDLEAESKEKELLTTEDKGKKSKSELTTGTGRRKTAVAKVFLWNQKGEITINGKDVDEVFLTELDKNAWLKPFHLVGVSHPKARFKASVKVFGSGKSSQLGAIVHGFSRALAKLSEENQLILAKAGMLTRDPRMVERKKYFLHKARKGPQYSKR